MYSFEAEFYWMGLFEVYLTAACCFACCFGVSLF